jgi:hypothetical protein
MTDVASLRREIHDIDSEKPRLVGVARRLGRLQRVALSDSDVRTLGIDDDIVVSVDQTCEFRAVWEDIVGLMNAVAPVETRESLNEDGEVCFVAVAAGSRAELKVRYHGSGVLEVKALWAASATVSRAMVVVDETYSL